MLNILNLLSGKRKYLSGMLLLLIISVISLAFNMGGSDEYDVARREILIRRIGHEILLQSGDSISRVLPVNKISENEYQISFENALSFQPDSLVNITQQLLGKDPLTQDYIVKVLNCANTSVAYGFAISKNKKDDIVSCKGRKQPIACYLINIQFKPRGITAAKSEYFFGAISIFAFVGIIFFRPLKPKKAIIENIPADIFTLGSTSFFTESRKLLINGETIELTRTETRVLRIFALSPNEAIERSRLQKEIWEDEGVIVGRSLDMFISKLRKKLELDPNIKIAVIRGKGYKLEINS